LKNKGLFFFALTNRVSLSIDVGHIKCPTLKGLKDERLALSEQRSLVVEGKTSRRKQTGHDLQPKIKPLRSRLQR
jgi:hypothetical protein